LPAPLRYAYIFLYGAFMYSAVEVLFRGRTHWTMTLTGGAALMAVYRVSTALRRRGLFVRCLACCAAITALEFAVGCVVNIGLGMRVWDYSHLPLNVLGQICPLFSLFWFLLCLPAIWLCGFVQRRVFM